VIITVNSPLTPTILNPIGILNNIGNFFINLIYTPNPIYSYQLQNIINLNDVYLLNCNSNGQILNCTTLLNFNSTSNYYFITYLSNNIKYNINPTQIIQVISNKFIITQNIFYLNYNNYISLIYQSLNNFPNYLSISTIFIQLNNNITFNGIYSNQNIFNIPIISLLGQYSFSILIYNYQIQIQNITILSISINSITNSLDLSNSIYIDRSNILNI
jgi:hypothetical protein